MIEDRSAGRPAARAWLWTERLAWAAGLAALAFWSLATASGAIEARQALRRFADLQSDVGRFASVPDQRLWSLARVRAWHDTLARQPPPPLGVLRIPRIGLEVPVLEGTGDWTLNRAVGWIEGTAKPGADGNSGIAGHRDGFFRGLKDIRDGDVLEVTLVTCYPFYFVGSAPQRFIVRAVLTEQAAPQKQPGFEEGGRHARD